MKLIYFLFVFVSVFGKAYAQQEYKITVNVRGLQNDKGTVNLGAYKTKEDFPKDKKAIAGCRIKIQNRKANCSFYLPKGTYAIGGYHDENSNKVLDFNIIGIPKEPYGFSKGEHRTINFDKSKFDLHSDVEIELILK